MPFLRFTVFNLVSVREGPEKRLIALDFDPGRNAGSGMIIRPAEERDAPGIVAIQNPVIRDTAITFNPEEKTEAAIRETIEAAPCFLVAEGDGEILGFASYDQFRKGPGYARTVEHTIVLKEGGARRRDRAQADGHN